MPEVHGITFRELHGWKYELLRPYLAALPEALWSEGRSFETEYLHLRDRDLLIKARYAWDGASGPTRDTPSAMRPSLVHDALCQLLRLRALPASAEPAVDAWFRQLCLADGMHPFRAWYWSVAVRWWPTVKKERDDHADS